jgi:nucleotide-binding universal stress UspA family protein
MTTFFSDVTIPVDASAPAARGVEFAIDLARDGARLHFCCVVDAEGVIGGAAGSPVSPMPTVVAMEADAQHACEHAVAAARRNGATADWRVVSGPIVPAIRRYADETNSAAVVIGTHGRTGPARMIFGSIAESLMQTSAVPVVVTHIDDIRGDGPIAVAVDGSAPATAALQTAIALAQAQRQRLTIVSVLESEDLGRSTAGAVLNDAAEAACRAGVEYELVTLVGGIAGGIVETATRQGSRMIVVGTHGRENPAHLLIGSVAAGVVEHARVPVMVVGYR